MNRISARLAVVSAAALFLVGVGGAAASAATPLPEGDALYALSCPQENQPAFPYSLQLWGIEASTAVSTPIGSGSFEFGTVCAGQPAWNPVTKSAWVIVLTDDHDQPSVLAEIDVATGVATPGALLLDGEEEVQVASLAIGLDGAAYGISYTQLYSVDLESGALTAIGDGLPITYGFSVDPTTGKFWAVGADGELMEIDVTTGEYTARGSLELNGAYGLQIDSAGGLWIIALNNDEATQRTDLYSAPNLTLEELPTAVGVLTVTDVGQPLTEALLLVPAAPSLEPEEPSLAATGASSGQTGIVLAGVLLLSGALVVAATRRARAGR